MVVLASMARVPSRMLLTRMLEALLTAFDSLQRCSQPTALDHTYAWQGAARDLIGCEDSPTVEIVGLGDIDLDHVDVPHYICFISAVFGSPYGVGLDESVED